MNIKDKTYRCKDCGAKIGWASANYGSGRCGSCAKKGKNNVMFGKHHSKKTCKKISKNHIGHIVLKETRKKLSKLNKGKKHPMFGKHPSKESKLKMSEAQKGNKNAFGYKHSKEGCLKISKATSGKNHPNWKDGSSLSPYSFEWTEELRQDIRCRDGHKCQICGKTEAQEVKEIKKLLCVHHMDYNKLNCKKSNLITLCAKCHGKTNYNRKKWIKYFTN